MCRHIQWPLIGLVLYFLLLNFGIYDVLHELSVTGVFF
jgi:hypothetical protein